jgi:hypothetical protein
MNGKTTEEVKDDTQYLTAIMIAVNLGKLTYKEIWEAIREAIND